MTISNQNLGINPNSCSPNALRQNFANTAKALHDLQQQLGDPGAIPPSLGNPGGIVGTIEKLQEKLQTEIDNMGGMGPSGFDAGYGGLSAESISGLTLDGSTHVMEFDTNLPHLNTTLTNTTGSKIKVTNAGDYFVLGKAELLPDSVHAVPYRFGTSIFIVNNGSEPSPVIRGANIAFTFGVGGQENDWPELPMVATGILTLSAGDEIQLKYGTSGTCTADYIFFTAGSPGNITTGAASLTIEWRYATLLVIRVG